MAKLSDGFAGGWTRQGGDALAEIELRTKKLDVFTNEFSPPYTGELGPGQNPNKSSQKFEAPHDDKAENDLPSAFNAKVRKSMGAAGIVSDQEMLDEIDRIESKFNVKLPQTKPIEGEDIFMKNEHGLKKGKTMSGSEKGSDNAKIPVQQTDPGRLTLNDEEKAMGAIEKRFSRLVSEKETEKRIESLENEMKDLKERDPKDTSGRQEQIKEEIALLKKTE